MTRRQISPFHEPLREPRVLEYEIDHFDDPLPVARVDFAIRPIDSFHRRHRARAGHGRNSIASRARRAQPFRHAGVCQPRAPVRL